MKLVTNKFKSGGLHEKHVVATWNVGNHLSIRFGNHFSICLEPSQHSLWEPFQHLLGTISAFALRTISAFALRTISAFALRTISPFASPQWPLWLRYLPVKYEYTAECLPCPCPPNHTRSSQRRYMQSVYFNCSLVWLFALVLGKQALLFVNIARNRNCVTILSENILCQILTKSVIYYITDICIHIRRTFWFVKKPNYINLYETDWGIMEYKAMYFKMIHLTAVFLSFPGPSGRAV